MTAASLALAVLRLGLLVLDHLKRQGLIRQGEMKALIEIQDKFNDLAKDMRAARDAVSDDADSVSSDPNNRDRQD